MHIPDLLYYRVIVSKIWKHLGIGQHKVSSIINLHSFFIN